MRLQLAVSDSPMPGSVLEFPVGPPGRTGGVVTAAMVQKQFPGAQVWRGNATGSWWAMHPDVDHLVEASSAAELAFALRAALAPVRGVYGRWALQAAA
jgi:hypothetical protein